MILIHSLIYQPCRSLCKGELFLPTSEWLIFLWHFLTFMQGLIQCNPLSSALFILVEEVFSQSLSRAIKHSLIRPYHLKRGCVIISHSLFPDDVIRFLYGCKASTRSLMSIISRNKQPTSLLDNISNISFIVAPSTIHKRHTSHT